MIEFEEWLNFDSLEELENDDTFKETLFPGESFVEQTEDLSEEEYVQRCAQLARKEGITYTSDQTSFEYEFSIDHPITKKADEIAVQLENSQEIIAAGVNIGQGFQRTLRQVAEQTDKNINWGTSYDKTPSTPYLDQPNEPTRDLAYFIIDNVEDGDEIAAGVLASAYFQR